MAEVVGVVSAGIGMAAFAFQVADKIERLKDLRQFNKGKAEDELEFLIQRLEVLRANLLSFETVQRSSAVDRAVSNCQLAYSSVDDILQRVTGKLTRGRNYVEELLHYGPNGVIGQVQQFELLEFFVRELGMNLENEDQRSVLN
ncbi:hypothetical protein ATERTT37_002367 [Aspergillus terreus]